MKHQNIKKLVLDLIADRGAIANRDLVASTGLTPQGAHHHLRKLVSAGLLRVEGAGRSTRYGLATTERWSFALSPVGLDEAQVFAEQLRQVPPLAALAERGRDVFEYAFCEMLNNAIDHAQARSIRVGWRREGRRLGFRIEDDGVGIFEHIRRAKGLGDPLSALQDLSKGKLTTWPERHTGEGIFFTARVAEYFLIESGTLRWLVDGPRRDMAVEHLDPSVRGTRVDFSSAPDPTRSLQEVFAAYTTDHVFDRTHTLVKLFEIGERFISRSEAKRLMAGLERFAEVMLDFQGVRTVGQGFVDEVFRVWSRAHPQVHLSPVNMSQSVAFMVQRGLPASIDA